MSTLLELIKKKNQEDQIQQERKQFNNEVQYRQEQLEKVNPGSTTKKSIHINDNNSSKDLSEFVSKAQTSLWDKVKQRALQLDIKGIGQNFGLGAKGALTKTIYSLNKYSGTEKTLNNIYNNPFTKQQKLNRTLDLINEDKKENGITNQNILLNQKNRQNIKLPILDYYNVQDSKKLKEIELLNKYNNPLEIDIRKDNEKIQENIDKQQGLLGKGLATIAPSMRRNGYSFCHRYNDRWWKCNKWCYARIKCFRKLYVRC